MNVYTTHKIRNVVLLGQGGSGKTSLAEPMAYLAGMTTRMGKVTDGNTISDYDKEEIKRHFSISTTLIPVPWDKVKINVLDTPGYFDFVGEVEEAVSAADAAIIVVSGKAGVQVGTQKAWNLCEKYKLPRMIFVTDMDVDDVSYRKVVEQLTELYGKKIAPLHFPIREDGKFVGYVNVVKQAGRKYIDKGKKEECPIPEYLDEYLEKYHDILMESVAETSEEFMDRYFEGDTFSVTEVSAALAMNVQEASIVPVCMGSPINLRGVSNLLDDICGYFPSPDKRSCNGISQKTNEIFEANYDFAKTKSAYVWKTIVDPFLGKYSLIKVASGVIKSDDTLLNVEKGEFVAIVGTSGSGKSTLLHMLGGLDRPSSGKVFVDGKDIFSLKDEELTIFRRRKIGFVFQAYNLVPVLNVYENIVLPIELDGGKVDKEFVKKITETLGLDQRLDALPNQLSGGQQQRVAIARALAAEPAIILADEPTGNLDGRTSQDVLCLLKVPSQKFSQTIVMITHNEEIAQLADRIIRIEDGHIQERAV